MKDRLHERVSNKHHEKRKVKIVEEFYSDVLQDFFSDAEEIEGDDDFLSPIVKAEVGEVEVEVLLDSAISENFLETLDDRFSYFASNECFGENCGWSKIKKH